MIIIEDIAMIPKVGKFMNLSPLIINHDTIPITIDNNNAGSCVTKKVFQVNDIILKLKCAINI